MKFYRLCVTLLTEKIKGFQVNIYYIVLLGFYLDSKKRLELGYSR